METTVISLFVHNSKVIGSNLAGQWELEREDRVLHGSLPTRAMAVQWKRPTKISNEKNIQREKDSSAIVSIRRPDNIQYLLQVECPFSLLSIF